MMLPRAVANASLADCEVSSRPCNGVQTGEAEEDRYPAQESAHMRKCRVVDICEAQEAAGRSSHHGLPTQHPSASCGSAWLFLLTLTQRAATVSSPPPASPGPPMLHNARMQSAAVWRTVGALSRAAYPVSTFTVSLYAWAEPAPCMASTARSSSCTAAWRTGT